MVVEKEFFITVAGACGPEEFREKNSRFISYLFPVQTAEEADREVAHLRKEYRDANHVCFAFRLGNHDGEEYYFRFSDDGEPGSTAGLPIYNEIKSKDYLNVLVAVVRYFGGIKLGTGGLVRAYAAGAKKVLDISQAVIVHIKREISLNFAYELTGQIMQVVQRYKLDILNREYGTNGVTIKLAIPIAQIMNVNKMLIDISGGKIAI